MQTLGAGQGPDRPARFLQWSRWIIQWSFRHSLFTYMDSVYSAYQSHGGSAW